MGVKKLTNGIMCRDTACRVRPFSPTVNPFYFSLFRQVLGFRDLTECENASGHAPSGLRPDATWINPI
jgi:hypothetical protein